MKRRQFLLSSAAAIAAPALPPLDAATPTVHIKGFKYIGSYTPSVGHLFYGHTHRQHLLAKTDHWAEGVWDKPPVGKCECVTPPTASIEDGIMTFTPGVWEVEDET